MSRPRTSPTRHATSRLRIAARAWLLVLAGLLPLHAIAAPLVQRHYGSADGLPVGSATSAAIDADGFLWVATHDGLARFDGQAFETYDSARFPQMGSNRVALLFRDRDRLYALTDSLEWLQVSSRRIERIRPDPDDPDSPVRFVHPDPLCLTLNRGIFCAGDAGFVPRRLFDAGLDVAAAVPDGDDDWLYALGEGVLLQRDGPPRVRWDDDALGWREHKPILADLVSPGRLRVTLPDGLLEVFSDAPARWLRADGEARLDIVQLRRDRGGRVMVGSDRGLFEIADDGDTLLRVAPAGGPSDLARSWRAPDGARWHNLGGTLFRDGEVVLRSTGLVNSLLFDGDGTAWVTTLRDGIHALARPRVDVIGTDAAAPAPNVYGVAAAPDGSIWRGTLGDGLAQLHADGSMTRDASVGPNPWTVAVAPDGGVYIAEVESGLRHRPPGATRFEPLPVPDALRGVRIHTVAFDSAQRLWLGSSDGAWMRDGTQWRRTWPAQGRADVRSIAFGTGATWYGSSRGLWRVAADGESSVAAGILDGVHVRSLFFASDGALWAASSGRGLLRIAADDPRGERALRLGRAEGLPSNTPHAMLEDADRNLWVNSNQGIFRLARTAIERRLQDPDAPLSPLRLGLADGLTDLEGNGLTQPAAAIDTRGRLLFASQRGVVRIDPQALPLRLQPPIPVIDGIEYHEETRLPDEHTTLPPGVRSLLLRYNAADLHAGGDVRFRYRLVPFDADWTDADARRDAPYTALPPGAYRFEVLAGNSDGAWSPQPAVREFVVPPAWFETTAFRTALALGVLLLLIALVQLRLRRLRRRAHQLDAQVHARTAELRNEKQRVERMLGQLATAHDQLAATHEHIAQRNLRLADQATRLEALDRFRTRLLADVSHELRTPLMLVHLPLQELNERATQFEPGDRRRHALALEQSGRLSLLIEQLVRLVQAEAQQVALTMRRIDVEAFVRRVVDGFEPAAQRGGFGFELVFAPQLPSVYGDPDHLQTVLGNLLDNAGKYAPRGSHVRVTAGLDDDGETLRIAVADSGDGFPAGQASQLFERFYRADDAPRAGRQGLGIGLALARELIELHGGRIGAEHAVDGGSTFWFTLPIGSAHVALDELELRDRAPHAPTPVPPTETPSPAERETIQRLLLVEDHPELARYLVERLSEWWPVVCVASAGAAWARLQQGDIGAVLSDVVLPGDSGIDLCRRIKTDPVLRAVPVLLMSAKAGDAARDDGIAAGAAAWLAKPFGLPAVRDALVAAWPAPPGDAPAPDATPATVDPLLQIALDQLADPGFGIPQWAARVFVSDRQLRRRVVDLTGMPPVAWLREQRLLRVHALLGSGACRTLAEAGFKAGFDNPAYLYRLYRVRFADA